MNKGDRVKEYMSFIRETNRPLYKHEIKDVEIELERLETELMIREITDIRYLADIDICRRYGLEPKDINPKYINYVIDDDDKEQEKVQGNIIVVSTHKKLREDAKTDYIGMRNNIIGQIREK